MIRKLIIKNFQKHQDLTLKLDPKVTTIVGDNDAGKSAIIRALRWLVFNRPQGDRFIRKGAKRTRVTLFVDGHRVSRIKGGTNEYKLDGKRLKGFGTKVPQDVSGLLNLDALNFLRQHDPPGFWFSLSPGEVSRRLNDVVDLGAIDDVLSRIASRLRREITKRSVIEERLQDAQEEKDRWSPAIRAGKDLKQVESLKREAEERAQRASEIAADLERLEEAQRKAADLGRVQQAREELDELLRLHDAWKVKNLRCSSLQAYVDDIETLWMEIADLHAAWASAKEEWHGWLDGEPCPLCGQEVEGHEDD